MNEQEKAIVTSAEGSPVSVNENGIVNTTSDPLRKFIQENNVSTGGGGDLVSLPSPYDIINSQSSVGLDPTRGNRKYIDNSIDTSTADFNEIQAQSQSAGRKALHGIGRIPIKVASEIAKMPGYLVGGIAALGAEEGSKMDTFVNNEWVKAIGDANEYLNNNLLPVHVTNAVKDGDLLDNISSTSFWATEGADGIGFILSMLAPGAAFNSLKLGSNAVKGLSAIGGTSDKISNAVNLAKSLGITGKNIDTGIITLANTIFEAAAEAGGAVQGFEDSYSDIITNRVSQLSGDTERAYALGNIDEETYNQEMSNHYAQADQEFQEQKGNLGANIFKANAAILLGPNLLQTQLLYSGVAKGMVKSSSNILTKFKNLTEFSKGVGLGVLSEGFWEEAMQSTVESMFTKSAKNNELTDSILSSFNVGELVDSYTETLNSTDGQKAIFLGALFGGLMNGVGSMKSSKNKYEQALTLNSVVGSGFGDINESLKALYKVDDITGELVKDANGELVTNINSLQELGNSIANQEIIGAVYNQILNGESTDSTTNSELLELIQGYTASGLAYGYAQVPGVAEDMFKQHTREYIESINNDNSLTDVQKRDAIQIADRTNKLVKKQLDAMLAISEVYDDVSPFNNTDRNKIKGTNKDQQFQQMYSALRREFMLNQGNIIFLKDIHDKLIKQSEKLESLLNKQPLDLFKNSEDIINAGSEIREERISKQQSVLKNVSEKIKNVSDKLEELHKLNEEKYFNEEYVQNYINKVAENNVKAEDTKRKEADYSRIVDQIKNANSVAELNKIKLNDPLYKESFEVHKEARKKELTAEKENSNNVERAINTENENVVNNDIQELSNISKVPNEIAETHALEAMEMNDSFADFNENTDAQVLKAFSYFFSNSNAIDIEDFLDMIINEGYTSLTEYINERLSELQSSKESTTQPANIIGEEHKPAEDDGGLNEEDIVEEVEDTETKSPEEIEVIEEVKNSQEVPSDNLTQTSVESVEEIPVTSNIHTPEDVGQDTNSTPSETAVLNEIPEEISQDEESEKIQRGTRIADREITTSDQKLPRLVMPPKATKIVEYFTNPINKMGKLLKLKIFETREESNPNYSMADKAVDIYNNSVKGKKFDMSAIIAIHRYEREKKLALNKIKSDNPNFNTLTSEVIKRYDSLIAKAVQGSSGNRDFKFEDFEILVKHLPINVVLENDLFTRLDHLADDVDSMRKYNELSGQQALRLRLQIIDALLTGNIDNVTVAIEKQLRGDLMLDYTEGFRNNDPASTDKYNYNSIGDLKMFEKMTEDQKINYIINNIYYDTGVDVVNMNGRENLYLSGSGFKGSIYLTIPTANGVDKMPVRLSQGKFTEQDANAILNITKAILETGVGVNEMTVQEYLDKLEVEDSTFLYDLIKPYADMATTLYGRPTLSQMMNLYLHNSGNANSKFIFSYTNLEIGGLFYKGNTEIQQKAYAKLGGDFVLTAESLDDPDVEQAFIQYIQKIRKNIKVKDSTDESVNFLTNPEYVSFLVNQGHLKTNIRIDVQAMGNSGNSSRTEALLSNSLKDAVGNNYKMSFNPQGLFDLPLDVTNGLYTESAFDNKKRQDAKRKEIKALNEKTEKVVKKPSVIDSLEEDASNDSISKEDVKEMVKEVKKTSDKLLANFNKMSTEDKYSYIDKLLANNKSLFKGNIKKLFENIEEFDNVADKSLVNIMTTVVNSTSEVTQKIVDNLNENCTF